MLERARREPDQGRFGARGARDPAQDRHRGRADRRQHARARRLRAGRDDPPASALPEDGDHLRVGRAPDRPRPAQGYERARWTTCRCRSSPSCCAPRSRSSPSSTARRASSSALNRELEQRVAERTAELEASTARRSRADEQLREADRRKDEFLALLAHELRNPLAPIRNAARILHAARRRATPSCSGRATSSSARRTS